MALRVGRDPQPGASPQISYLWHIELFRFLLAPPRVGSSGEVRAQAHWFISHFLVASRPGLDLSLPLAVLGL